MHAADVTQTVHYLLLKTGMVVSGRHSVISIHSTVQQACLVRRKKLTELKLSLWNQEDLIHVLLQNNSVSWLRRYPTCSFSTRLHSPLEMHKIFYAKNRKHIIQSQFCSEQLFERQPTSVKLSHMLIFTLSTFEVTYFLLLRHCFIPTLCISSCFCSSVICWPIFHSFAPKWLQGRYDAAFIQKKHKQTKKPAEFKVPDQPSSRPPRFPCFYFITLIRRLRQLSTRWVSLAGASWSKPHYCLNHRLPGELRNQIYHSAGPPDSIQSTINRSFIKKAREETYWGMDRASCAHHPILNESAIPPTLLISHQYRLG